MTEATRTRAREALVELEQLLTERIQSMAEASQHDPAWCQARQLVVYYRSLVWAALDAMGGRR